MLKEHKKSLFIIIFILLLSFSYLLGYKTGSNKNNKAIIKKSYSYIIKTKEKTKCSKEKLNLYYQAKNYNIYLYCLDSITIKDNIEEIELKDKLIQGETILNEIMNTFDDKTTYKDGGSILYKDNGKTAFTNNGLSILKCNTIDGNTDLYIGPKTMKYEDDFCKEQQYVKKQFIKTYKVLNIAESNDYNYVYVTVRQFQKEEIETVKIPRSLSGDIVIDKDYEFTFKTKNRFIKENTKSIFANTEIISIKETNKVGLDQINENI